MTGVTSGEQSSAQKLLGPFEIQISSTKRVKDSHWIVVRNKESDRNVSPSGLLYTTSLVFKEDAVSPFVQILITLSRTFTHTYKTSLSQLPVSLSPLTVGSLQSPLHYEMWRTLYVYWSSWSQSRSYWIKESIFQWRERATFEWRINIWMRCTSWLSLSRFKLLREFLAKVRNLGSWHHPSQAPKTCYLTWPFSS